MQKNEMMNLIRKAKDRDPDAFTTLMQQQTKDMYRVAPMEEYEPSAVEDSYNLELKEALAALDEIYRIPMLLHYGQGWKTKEIAELLHVSASTIQTRLARGREKLAVYYRKE